MTLQQIIDESNHIVFFGGAGVSTESGIPDFRSVDGLYNQKYKYPPEEILSEHEESCIRIPMWGDIRSLNLANSVSVILYEALRQNGFEKMTLAGELHRLSWK